MIVEIDGKKVDVQRWKRSGKMPQCNYDGKQYFEAFSNHKWTTNTTNPTKDPDNGGDGKWLDPPLDYRNDGLRVSENGQPLYVNGDSMNLYEVRLVTDNGKKHKLEFTKEVFARSEKSAQLNAGVHSFLEGKNLEFEDVTVFVTNLGAVHSLDD